MQELTIKLPDKLWQRLERWARTQKKEVADVILELLTTIPPVEESDLPGKYQRFFRESGLFIQVNAEEKNRYKPVGDLEREELARRFSVGKPLSRIIIEERR